MTDASFNPVKTVYISNLSEDVWPFIEEFSDKEAKQYEIEENATILSDRDLFSFTGQDNVTLILPTHIDATFVQYYLDLFGNKNFRILVPQRHSGQTCNDILREQFLLNEIGALSKNCDRLNLISYSTSPQFFELVQVLKEKNIPIFTPESPESSNAWTINFYGSKSGIRQLSQQSEHDEPDFKMPEGIITFGIEDAAKIAAQKYLKNGGIVLKTNKGHSGAGILIYRGGDLPTDYEESAQQILAALKKEAYWNKFPIVIEKYVESQTSIGGGFPNVEFRILKNGRIELAFYGGMRITKQGVFKGMEVSREALSDRIAAQIIDTGFFIGEQLSREGYRGHFDVDFIAAKNGELYVTESNVRRTGVTHLYYTAVALFGKNFMHETYALSNNLYDIVDKKISTFDQLHTHLKPLLFHRNSEEGIIITAINMLFQHKFGYIIFGKTKSRALEIERTMENLLGKSKLST